MKKGPDGLSVPLPTPLPMTKNDLSLQNPSSGLILLGTDKRFDANQQKELLKHETLLSGKRRFKEIRT
jgi:hypothetical protein